MKYILIVKNVMRGDLFLILCKKEDERDMLELEYMNDSDYELVRICNIDEEKESNVFWFSI